MALTNQAQRVEKLIEATLASLEREGFDLDEPVDPGDPDSPTLRRSVRVTAMSMVVTDHLLNQSHAVVESMRQQAWDAFVLAEKDTP